MDKITIYTMSAHRVCLSSLRWVLNYRAFVNNPKLKKQIIDLDGHSGGSWAWSKAQSEIIDEYGFDKWVESENSKGYSHMLKKLFDKQH